MAECEEERLQEKATARLLQSLAISTITSMFLTQTLLLQQKQVYSKRNSLTDFLTAVSPSQI